MSFSSPTFPRPTPWVARLIAATAVVQLLLETIFTSGQIRQILAMDPGRFLDRPWGIVTYLFVHSGFLHLATNMLWFYLLGTAVENRLGSRTFLFFYLYCGVGAALVSLLVNLVTPVGPMIGASGAVFGVSVAFAMLWPDAEIMVFPLPIAIRARTLVLFAAALELVLAQIPAMSGVAHEAHLGGMFAGWLFFKLQSLSGRRAVPSFPPQPERVVMVQQTAVSRDSDPRLPVQTRPIAARAGTDPVAAELDRVLDKISATGIESLTAEERRFLDEVSKRKQRDLN